MKKIVLVAYYLNPRGLSEAVVASSWLKIIARNYNVEVYTDIRNEKGLSEMNIDNVTFHYIQGTHKWRKLESRTGLKGIGISSGVFFRNVKKKLRNINLSKISLIHCITPFNVGSYNSLYELGVPVLVGPVGGALPTPKGFFKAFRFQFIKNIFRDSLYKLLVRRPGWQKYMYHAERIIVGTNYLKDVLPKQVHGKCVTIYDSVVDTDYWKPGVNAEQSTVKILFVGRLVSQKGPVLLLDAISRCIQKGLTGFSVELVGEGVLEDNIKSIIKKNNLQGCVQLPGNIGKQALLKKYQESDIFCLPTLRDPGGNAVLEALACGLPVITSNYGGPRDVVTKECGIKIDVKNYDDYVQLLSEAVYKLVTETELRRRMALAARKVVEDGFSVKALEGKIYDVYSACINEAQASN